MEFAEFYGLSNGGNFVEFERVLDEKMEIVLILWEMGNGRGVIFVVFSQCRSTRAFWWGEYLV
jgi:hypothetical protein